MGQVMQRAGGGKVSTTNLAAANIDNGVTVTVKQGSKTVQQVTGSLKTTTSGLAAGNVKSGVTVTVKQGSKTVQQVTGSYSPYIPSLRIQDIGTIGPNSPTINVAAILPGIYRSLSIANFGVRAFSFFATSSNNGVPWSNYSMYYNASTGILSGDVYRAHGSGYSSINCNYLNVYVYYVA